MKKGYKRLFIFQILLILILFLNSFVSNILNNYYMVLFLGIVLIIFKYIFGFEKDRHRYVKDIIFDIIIFCLIYFLLYYLLGIFVGFSKTGNYYSLYGIINFIIPTVLFIVFKEVLRYMMMKKSEGCILVEVITCIFFLFLEITNSIYFSSFKDGYDLFIFISLVLLPAISSNIVCTFLTRKVGYKPIIFYLLVMNLYPYLLPLIPNPNEYIVSIIKFLLPLILFSRVSNFFNKEKDEVLVRNYNKGDIISYIVPVFFMIVIVYFTSGYFNFLALAIASGSMEPNISKGDVVIVEKLSKEDEIFEGQIIAYNYEGVVIVHRVEKILEENDKFYYYTKGDANKTKDDYIVNQDMIVGIVKLKIPFLGLPTVWLSEI